METKKLDDGSTVDFPQAGLDPLQTWHPKFSVREAGKPDRYQFMIQLGKEYFLCLQADENDLMDLAERIQQAIKESHERFSRSPLAESSYVQGQSTSTDSESR